MRSLTHILILLFAVSLVSGCDTSNPETTEDILEGDWRPYFIADETGDLTTDFLDDVQQYTFRFRSNRTFSIYLVFNAAGHAKGYTDEGVDGAYHIETDPVETLVWDVIQTATVHTTLETSFTMAGRDKFTIKGKASELGLLIVGTPISGDFEIGLQRHAAS